MKFYVTHKLVGNPILTNTHDRPHDRIRFELRAALNSNAATEYVGSIELIRIPSNRNMTHAYATGDQYNMADFMRQMSERTGIIADEMQLDGNFQCFGCRKHLQSNDLYYVKVIFVDEKYRDRGMGKYMMELLPSWVRRVTREPNPVFAAVPYCYRRDYNAEQQAEETKGVKLFLERCGWKPVQEESPAWYYQTN